MTLDTLELDSMKFRAKLLDTYCVLIYHIACALRCCLPLQVNNWLSDLARVHSAAEVYNIGSSYEGRQMNVIKVGLTSHADHYIF